MKSDSRERVWKISFTEAYQEAWSFYHGEEALKTQAEDAEVSFKPYSRWSSRGG